MTIRKRNFYHILKIDLAKLLTTEIERKVAESNIQQLGVPSKKKNSIFTDIVQIGGREVNPISKNLKEMIF